MPDLHVRAEADVEVLSLRVGSGTSRKYSELLTLKSFDYTLAFHLTLTMQVESTYVSPKSTREMLSFRDEDENGST